MVLAAANAVGDATSNAEDMAADATDVAEAIFEQTTEAAGEVVAEHVAQAVAGVCCVVVSWVFGDAFLDKLQINRTGFLLGPSQPTIDFDVAFPISEGAWAASIAILGIVTLLVLIMIIIMSTSHRVSKVK